MGLSGFPGVLCLLLIDGPSICPIGEEYSESQALILTFSLNNYPSSDPHFDMVMLWEKRFLEIVQEFQQKYADNYSIAYMAEVWGRGL